MEGSPLAGSGWWVRAARRQREQEKVGTGGRQGGHGQVDQRAGDSGRGWQRRRRRQRGRACGQRAGLWLWRCGQRRRDWDGPSRQRQQGPHPTACNQRPNPPTAIAPEGGGPLRLNTHWRPRVANAVHPAGPPPHGHNRGRCGPSGFVEGRRHGHNPLRGPIEPHRAPRLIEAAIR